MGHLKANCLKLRRPQYPLYSRYDIIIDSVCRDGSSSSSNNMCVTVCGDVSSNSSNITCVTVSGVMSSSSSNNNCVTVCSSNNMCVTVCGDVSSSSSNLTCVTACRDMSSSTSNNTCVTAGGDMSSYSYNNAYITVSSNVSNSSCNDVVSTVCGSEVVRATTCEMSSNHYITDHSTVGVVSTSIVNMPPKLTTTSTSTVNVGPYTAAAGNSCAIVPPEIIPACCSSGIASNELEAHDLVDPTIVSAPTDVDMNVSKLHDLSDEGQALTTFWEIEEGHHQLIDVQGRLRGSLSFWENTLGPATWIISCIKEGYKLPLRSIPDRFRRPNQQSALDHQHFVTQAIQELEENRCVTKVQEIPYICSPLLVVDNTHGKLWLVLNLRYLNQFLWIDRFKY